jgi:hypothetical protein
LELLSSKPKISTSCLQMSKLLHTARENMPSGPMETSSWMFSSVSERLMSLIHNPSKTYRMPRQTPWVFWECPTSLMPSEFLSIWQLSSKLTVRWRLWGGFQSIKRQKQDLGIYIIKSVRFDTNR